MGKFIQNKLVLILCLCFVAFSYWMITTKEFEKTVYSDLDGDGVDEEITKKLSNITVRKNGEVCWRSDIKWKCDDFIVYDIDRDGKQEFLVLNWKMGSFGKHTPFWRVQDMEISQHIYIFKWSEEFGRLKATWMSSALKPEIKSWNMTDEGTIHIISMDDEDMIWIWGVWGLERIDKIPELE